MSNEEGEVFFRRCAFLEKVCKENAEYWAINNSHAGKQLCETLKHLLDQLKVVKALADEISSFAHEYDFDEKTPGNGYRSFLSVVTACIDHTLEICQRISESSIVEQRKRLNSFQIKWHIDEIRSFAGVLDNLAKCLRCLLTLRGWSNRGDLFPIEAHSTSELFVDGDINQLYFYGRCLGFQFCSSMQRILRFISISMAGYSEMYYSKSLWRPKAALGILKAAHYALDPELKAKRIVSIAQNADVKFCKAYWFLSETEFMSQLPRIFGSSVAVNRVIHIPSEPLKLAKLNSGDFVDIPIPESHLGASSTSVRLISSKYRQGMPGGSRNNKNVYPPAKGLVIHCHGGGFVAQSSKSHEMYLRDWAEQLDTPIISIDYSLAPEAPFPRASEEVFYTYCWALKNSSLLGSLGEKIVMAGDSAGANLNVGATLKCIEFGIRKPDGLLVSYCPFLVSFVPSPARLLCIIDPLLPFGFMMRCLKAYVSSEAGLADASHIPFNKRETETAENISRSICKLSRPPSPSLDARHHEESVDSPESNRIPSIEMKESPPSKSGLYSKLFYQTGENDQFVKEFAMNCDNEAFSRNIPTNPSATNESDNSNLFDFFRYAASNFGSKIRQKFRIFNKTAAATVNSRDDIGKIPSIDDHFSMKSLSDEFDFEVPGNPLMSPYLASDEYLGQLPPTKILTVEMDPCLDDCVMLGKKLKRLGVQVTLDIIKGLPHGFLNFVKLSKDADDGSKLVADRIGGLLTL